jgi:mannan endo-1,4-beta-mannosidase
MNVLSRTLIRTLLATFVVLVAIPAGPAAAARTVSFGAWTPGSPFGGNLSATNALENSIQRRVGIVSWYQDWNVDGSHFRWNVAKSVRAIKRSGRRAMLTWEPTGPDWTSYSYDNIAAGAKDDYIRWWAHKVGKLHTRVYVRLAHEMNGNWYPWGGTVGTNSAAKFRRMWRHVVDVARAAGARNVKWVWCPLTENVPNTAGNRMARYYPGRRYVDVLSLDGYNWGAATPQYGGWRSFRKIFAKPYKRISRLGPQPVWIAEVGSASDGGDKSEWVRKMWKVASRWKRLKAIVWFNQDGDRDWSTASAASAFHRR